MMVESQLQADIRLAVGKLPHARLFRNNVALGWVGEVIHRDTQTVTLAHPVRVTTGLVTGSADLIGWTSIVITPRMVGAKVAVFSSGEVKPPGARTAPAREVEQANWRVAVHQAGGFSAILRSVRDGLDLVRAL